LSENADTIRRAFGLWNAGERESQIGDIDPEVELRMATTQFSGQDAYRGYDGYREWIATMEESFELWELDGRLLRMEAFRTHAEAESAFDALGARRP
jgi:hypothetical protein